MEHLWAPWRNTYISKVSEAASLAEVFSRIAQSTDDEENHVLLRSKAFFVLLNLYPYNLGHLMIVPYRATGNLEDLSEDEMLEMMQLTIRMKAALTKAFAPHGFNVGLNLGAAAGAGISEHLHLHIVPRWRHDANFMTTVAEVRVHPGDLAAVYAKLKEALA
ncbi:HIT family hydrolase [Verrucomicrobia bacterium LW23]|nr:HIT family hydrolase [Verrucomicrobia bacterium LW23]